MKGNIPFGQVPAAEAEAGDTADPQGEETGGEPVTMSSFCVCVLVFLSRCPTRLVQA